MMFKSLIIILTMGLSACVTRPLTNYPTYTAENTISISSNAISKARYGKPADKSIANSQVLIGPSPINPPNSGIAPLTSLITTIAFSGTGANKGTYNKLNFLNSLNFSNQVEERIKQNFPEQNFHLKIIHSDQPDLKIIPFVFISSSPKDFFLDFTLVSEIKNKIKLYKYRDRSFNKVEDINEEKFRVIADTALNELVELLAMDLNKEIDLKKLDQNLQTKCEKISGKTWGKITPINKVNFYFIENKKNYCIAALKDGLGGTFPQVYIFNQKLASS